MNEQRPEEAPLRREQPVTSVRASDYLVMRPLLDWLQHVAPEYASGILLDYGCGNKPYRSFFRHRVTSHVGVDVAQNRTGTVEHVVAPGEPLPFPNESIDTVLSTQVLEHVPEPERYLAEASRVLRRGGHLILTCPGSYMLHEEPHDYYRYTEYGLRFLAGKFAMEVVRIDAAGGAWRLLGQIFLNHRTSRRVRRVPVLSEAIYRLTLVIVNAACSLLDRMSTNTKDTVNLMLVARKR